MHNFKQLQVWQEAILLAKDVYEVTVSFPSDEKYGLTSQIRRSATSIPANIAEGSGRSSDKDFSRFLSIAIGSSFEFETHLILAQELKLISPAHLEELEIKFRKIQKMLYNLMQKYKD